LKTLVFDVECFPNFWCCSFLEPESGRHTTLRQTLDGPPMDVERLRRLMTRNRIVSFNGNGYDVPKVFAAIKGFTNTQLKRLSDEIITEGLRPWHFEDKYEIRIPKLDHIDIIDVAPGMVGLKLYGARLHSNKLQDLPYEPDTHLTPEQMDAVEAYNINDLWVTWELYQSLAEDIRLREDLREMAGVDLRSKKGAQVAALVLKQQITKRTGSAPGKSQLGPGYRFKYDPPPYLTFQTEQMRSLLDEIRATDFQVSGEGKVALPRALEGRIVTLSGCACRMGIGGLHSTESGVSHHSDEDGLLIDRDFDSYYPNVMLALRLAPRHIGDAFLDVFGGIVDSRMEAKGQANDASLPDATRKAAKKLADRLKLIVNSTFGLTGSRYSYLYDPKVMIQVTLTGQLLLLWLAEQAEVLGIPVASANTDGIVVKVPEQRKPEWDDVIVRCEAMTGLTTEETKYSALYSRDVNSYLALKANGSVKAKGAFGPTGPQKNPTFEICIKAAVDFITKGASIEDTIYNCTDIRQFVAVRTVKGGALFGNTEYLGKVVRWYMAEGSDGFIRTKTTHAKTGNWTTVAKTQGCCPLMNLPDEFPDDVDYRWYIAETREILMQIGYTERPPEPLKVRLTKANTMPALLLWGAVGC
jgi:hypothetical protein